jgi:hypothetical protein
MSSFQNIRKTKKIGVEFFEYFQFVCLCSGVKLTGFSKYLQLQPLYLKNLLSTNKIHYLVQRLKSKIERRQSFVKGSVKTLKLRNKQICSGYKTLNFKQHYF